MGTFEDAYRQLNPEQRQAVDTLDGPLLVMAGPGTGKTQLLSLRVANILKRTDTLPQNILCLTFTDSGAVNMRDRLSLYIGKQAYDVGIYTYHAFGGELIRRFPQYFESFRAEEPIDDIGRYEIVSGLVANLSYDNPLKQSQYHLGDLIGTISDLKRALLGSNEIRQVATENAHLLEIINPKLRDIFGDFGAMPRTYAKAYPPFQKLMSVLETLGPSVPSAKIKSIASLAASSLAEALEIAGSDGKSTPLTAWKNEWLSKNDNDEFVLSYELANNRLSAIADILDSYQAALGERGLYDFDDMILSAIEALQANNDLRFSLQEQYLYILLDEFQDTNASQFEIVSQLTNNPISEGRPNVLAVGDDDQAIYAFQGATMSNMLDFTRLYRDITIINLQHNYRSHREVLETASSIVSQIDARLHHSFKNVQKNLSASNRTLPKNARIERQEFTTDIAQYSWMAASIKKLIDTGVPATEIAVLAPKHRYLEPIVPFLNQLDIPVRYEKREDILDTPIVRQLVTMAQLVQSLSNNDLALANTLWPEILSYDFWQFPVENIWQCSWDVNDQRSHWTKILLASKTFHTVANLFLTLSGKYHTESLETMLDFIIGNEPVTTNNPKTPLITSPLRSYYTSTHMQEINSNLFYETISHITVLRQKLRDHQRARANTLQISDLIHFVEMYRGANQPLVNTSPYSQQADAVQVMTVFKAKGLEYSYVFLPSCLDDVWGDSSRQQTNKLTLPPNLAQIRPAGSTPDERLRIFFVAITRAKIGLFLTSYSFKYNGKPTKRLKYLDEEEQEDGSFKSLALPGNAQKVIMSDHSAPKLETLMLGWHQRHTRGLAQTRLQDLLKDRLERYQLSPTHVISFMDTEYGGPENFFLFTLLRFPKSIGSQGQYGSSIHETLEWVQHFVNEHLQTPSIAAIQKHFTTRLAEKKLSSQEEDLLQARGNKALSAYFKSPNVTFKAGDIAEYNFRDEGVFVEEAHLAGKIDLLRVDTKNKTVTIVDYKTGKSFNRWSSDTKLYRYKRQLYCYKLLVENSNYFRDYSVIGAELVFIEPDEAGKINRLLLHFEQREIERTQRLIRAVWKHIKVMDFPSIERYDGTLKSMRSFEDSLLGDNQKEPT